jgi:prepilin-type N-terminal cleavage/methylation domain-containing protein
MAVWNRTAGFSLVELLVALVIGATLSFGAMTLYLHSKRSQLQDEQLARLQENGRYALRYISHELVMAGFRATLPAGTPVVARLTGSACFNYLLDTESALGHIDNVDINGISGSTAGAFPADCRLLGRHQPGSDMLVSRRTVDTATVRQGQQIGSIDKRAIYLHTDDAMAGPQRRGSFLERGRSAGAVGMDLWEYVPQILLLRRYSLAPGDGMPSLCRLRLSASANAMAPVQCLVEGIQDLQLEYGIDDDGDHQADRFESSPGTDEMQGVVAARVYLLVRSVQPVVGYRDERSYALGTKHIRPANDGYYRRVLQTTVLLRNAPGLSL